MRGIDEKEVKIIVVGIGRVGRKVASQLSKHYEVTVVDRDPNVVEFMNYNYDVLAVHGDGTSPDVLKSAGVEDADYVISTTSSDQVNILTSGAAKAFANPFTIARVKSVEYLKIWGKGGRGFGVDLMVCSIPLVAKSISNVVDVPYLRFLRGLVPPKIFIAEMEPEADVDARSHPNLSFIRMDGHLLVIGDIDGVKHLSERTSKIRDIVIIGGGNIGLMVAELLESRGFEPTLVEISPERAEELSGKLKRTTVLLHNGFDVDFWKRERLDRSHVAVVTLENDEKSFFMANIAKHLGVQRVFAIAHESEYLEMFERHGIIAVSPEAVTAERIIISTQKSSVRGVVSVVQGLEILAVEITELSRLAGKTIGAIKEELPVVIGPILRKGELLMPTDTMKLQQGDVVTVVVKDANVEEVAPLI